MRLSRLFSATYKDAPREAELTNHRLLLRAGMIHQYGSGIFALMPLGHRIVQKIIKIVREEMNAIDSQEVSMTCAAPKELWEETGRYSAIDGSMFRFEDRHGQGLVLNMTHEEPVVDLVRNSVNSYKQLPFSTFQIQTKFRDEARPRGGLIRLREFVMKDAYSFHIDEDDLKKTYDQYFDAYVRAFKRMGIKNFIDVSSDNGMFGGKYSHEFMLVTESGEDTLIICPKCDYKANKEIATSTFANEAIPPVKVLEKVPTPDQKTIESLARFLKIETHETIKAVLFETREDAEPVITFIRGDLDVMHVKLETSLGQPLVPAGEAAIKKARAVAGSTGPIGLNLDACTVVLDQTTTKSGGFATGANEADVHYIGFDPNRDFFDKLSGKEKEKVKVLDIAAVREGDPCPKCSAGLNIKRGIEIGNIFHLGTKYTASMNFTVLDQNGKSQHPIMGCYGLGITRALAAIVEEHNDENGMILPISVAPYQVLINVLNYKTKEVREVADRLYEDLRNAGVEVLLDDRDKKPGFQFKDADLIGVPVRVVVSPRLLQAGEFEMSLRSNPREKMKIPTTEVQAKVKEAIDAEYSKLN